MTINKDILSAIKEEADAGNISASQAEEITSVVEGRSLMPLYADPLAKKIFSPDMHSDRFDYLMRKILADKTIESDGSMSNESLLAFKDSKKMIYDVTGWLKDKRTADLEFQLVAQQYIFNRMELYTSEMLMLQFHAEDGQPKKNVTYKNANGVVSVVLMRKSPKVFRKHSSGRYIHRITNMTTDTGISFPTLRKIAFVQLDVALEQFISKTYNEDEDIELLTLLAMIADINNEIVAKEASRTQFFKDIYNDVRKFSSDKEVQSEMLDELKARLSVLDYNSNIEFAQDEGIKKGIRRMIKLSHWLKEQDRGDEYDEALDDEYKLNILLAEMKASGYYDDEDNDEE